MASARQQAPSPRPEAAGRLGALAGIVPTLMLAVWTWISGWGGTPGEFVLALSILSAVAIVAGWIVGSRVGSSTRSTMLGVVAYAATAWLIYVPVGVIGSTWQGVQDGSVADLGTVAVRTTGGLAYGLVSSIWVVILLLPFGAGWMLTYRLLQRAAYKADSEHSPA